MTEHSSIYLWIDYTIVIYFLVLSTVYSFIFLMGIPVLYRRFKETHAVDINLLMHSENAPAITVILAAYNEREIIHEAIKSILKLDYPHFFLIVSNDGSEDGTLESLIATYDMVQVPPAYPPPIKTEKIKAIYRSKKHAHFMLIDKENGGQPDALNAAINVSTTPYFITTDADCILEKDVLSLIARTLVTEKNTVGVGGSLRVGNGCLIKDGEVVQVRLPRTYFPSMQVLEYLRSFFFGRLGWNSFGGALALSGAFSVHERNAVIETGGFSHNAPAPDINISLRLHGKMHELRKKYTMRYVADAIVWTQVPKDYEDLRQQRIRWHTGVIDICVRCKHMLFNPKYGAIGSFYLPYIIFAELLGPIVEAFAYCYFLWCLILGILNVPVFFMFIAIAWGFDALLTFFSLAMEQATYKKYVQFKDVLRLVWLTFIENIGYRQMSVWWRLEASVKYFFKRKHSKSHPTRHGYSDE